jgi:CheY-like chemotaxis protein
MILKEIVASIIQLLGIVTAWPVILLIILLIFRHEFRQFLPELARRLKKADIAGSSFEFTEVAVKALQDSIEAGFEELKDNPDELASFVRKQVEKLSEANASAKSLPRTLPLSGYSILWVDDNPLNIAYEANVFKELGATIKQVTSSNQALPYLTLNIYDLIISDIHREENGYSNPTAGYDLLEKIRQQKIRVPFVFYTSNTARVPTEKSKLADGVADDPSELQDLVLHILQR